MLNIHLSFIDANKETMSTNSDTKSTVFIVDDDQAIRHAMELLMRSVGLDYEIFHSGDDFLSKHTNDRAGSYARK
ncbi:MAG: hypothetical protein O3A13_16670 [Proteobacteria bacterium]|nr:hypothetical protein [Pseudomonadota bacterium]